MRESELEAKVTRFCKDNGLLCYKWSSPSQRGVPDRIIIGPGGVLFLEMKAEGKRPTKLQEYHIDKINAVNPRCISYEASWADNFEDAKNLIETYAL